MIAKKKRMKASRRRRSRENELAKKKKTKTLRGPQSDCQALNFLEGDETKRGGKEALTHQRREISGCGAGGGRKS